MLGLASAVFPAPSVLAVDFDVLWQPMVEIGGRVGTQRSLAETGLFFPLWQNDRSLVFFNARGYVDNGSVTEGNFGLGIRHMLDSGWNVGAYGYFDHRKTGLGNQFSQLTVGAEALSQDLDFRINGYFPVGPSSALVQGAGQVSYTPGAFLFRQGQERALPGLDFEIGWRVPVFDPDAPEQLRLYGGGYHFADGTADPITGIRGRLDLAFDSAPLFGNGSRFNIGTEIQHDDVRGTQGAVMAQLRIPIDPQPARSTLTPMQRRMMDPVIRDIDIVTQTGAFGQAEKITELADGGAFEIFDSRLVMSADLAAAVANAGADSTVVLAGDFTDLDDRIMLQPGQTILGSGAIKLNAPSGEIVTVQTPGSTLSGQGLGSTPFQPRVMLEMADQSTLIGVTASLTTATPYGARVVLIDAVDGARVLDSNLTVDAPNNAATPILVTNNAANTTIVGNALSAVGGSVFSFFGAQFVGSTNTEFSNNRIEGSSPLPPGYALFFNLANSGLSGSGNTSNMTECHTSGANTGSIGFSHPVTNCP